MKPYYYVSEYGHECDGAATHEAHVQWDEGDGWMVKPDPAGDPNASFTVIYCPYCGLELSNKEEELLLSALEHEKFLEAERAAEGDSGEEATPTSGGAEPADRRKMDPKLRGAS